MTAVYTPIAPGAILLTWCSTCHGATPHRYEPQGKRKLVCENCEKESEAQK